jgi:hypothetical protein
MNLRLRSKPVNATRVGCEQITLWRRRTRRENGLYRNVAGRAPADVVRRQRVGAGSGEEMWRFGNADFITCGKSV